MTPVTRISWRYVESATQRFTSVSMRTTTRRIRLRTAHLVLRARHVAERDAQRAATQVERSAAQHRVIVDTALKVKRKQAQLGTKLCRLVELDANVAFGPREKAEKVGLEEECRQLIAFLRS